MEKKNSKSKIALKIFCNYNKKKAHLWLVLHVQLSLSHLTLRECFWQDIAALHSGAAMKSQQAKKPLLPDGGADRHRWVDR